jgi:hypothetical protein
MSLWQITVIAFLGAIAALLGAVVIYARALTNKVGNTNATLRRLEVALLTSGMAKEKLSSTGVVAAEAAQSPVSAVPEHGARAAPAVRAVHVAVDDGIPSYLTVRELKAISRQGRPSGDNAVAMYAVSLKAFNTSSVPQDSPELRGTSVQGSPDSGAACADVVEEVVETSLESREALTAGAELARSDAVAPNEAPAVTGELPPDAELTPSAEAPPNADATASAELQGSPSNSATNAPAADTPEADAEREERRKRDALLIMSAQRRRRRARGY